MGLVDDEGEEDEVPRSRSITAFALGAILATAVAGCGTSNKPGSVTTTDTARSQSAAAVRIHDAGYDQFYWNLVVKFGHQHGEIPTVAEARTSRDECLKAFNYSSFHTRVSREGARGAWNNGCKSAFHEMGF